MSDAVPDRVMQKSVHGFLLRFGIGIRGNCAPKSLLLVLMCKPARAFFIHLHGVVTGRSHQELIGVSLSVPGLIFDGDKVVQITVLGSMGAQ